MELQTIGAAQQALRVTFFHWGLHAWAIYAVVGLALVYFAYRHNLPTAKTVQFTVSTGLVKNLWTVGDSIRYIFATISFYYLGVRLLSDLVLPKLTLVYIIYLVLSKSTTTQVLLIIF